MAAVVVLTKSRSAATGRRWRAADVAVHSVPDPIRDETMAKTQRKLKKANHGKRPGSAKARRLKRKHIRT